MHFTASKTQSRLNLIITWLPYNYIIASAIVAPKSVFCILQRSKLALGHSARWWLLHKPWSIFEKKILLTKQIKKPFQTHSSQLGFLLCRECHWKFTKTINTPKPEPDLHLSRPKIDFGTIDSRSACDNLYSTAAVESLYHT